MLNLLIRKTLIFLFLFFAVNFSLFSQIIRSVETNDTITSQQKESIRLNDSILQIYSFHSVDPYYFWNPLFSYQYRGSLLTLLAADFVYYKYYSGFFMGMSLGTNGAANASYNSNGRVVLDNLNDSLMPTGKHKIGRGTITVGYIHRLNHFLYMYSGFGYGWYHWCDIYERYDEYDIYNGDEANVNVRNLSKWYGGVETNAGLIFDLKKISINTGISILNFKKESLILTGGIGIFLLKRSYKL